MNLYRRVAAVGLVLAIAIPAHAEDTEEKKKKREQLISEIQRMLSDTRGYLDGTPGKSSTSDIDYAMQKANEIKSKAGELRDVKESDSNANMMNDRYPGYADKFRESAQYLKQMKEFHLRQADVKLWEKCQEADRKLREQVDRFVEKNDPRGMDEIPKAAEEAQRQIDGELKKADEHHRDMDRAKGYAKNFSESDGWGDVKSKLHDSADTMWDQWKQRHENTHMKCDDLAKGKHHPYVVKALEKLSDNSKTRDGLYIQLDRLLEESAGLLYRVVGHSETAEIDSAINMTDRLLSTLDMLKNARGEDDKARKMTDVWPDKVKEYRHALGALKMLKHQQRILDKAKAACKADEDELNAVVRKYVGNPDDAEEGIDAITKKAEAFGREYTGKLEAAERKRAEQEKYKDEAQRFSFDEGKWRTVKENLYGGAQAIYSHFKDSQEEAKSACGRLAMGVKHPDVEKGLAELGKSNQGASLKYEEIQAEYKKWQEDRKKWSNDFKKENVDRIRMAFCDGDEEHLDERVQRATEAAAGALRGALGTLQGRLDALIAQADKLTTNSKETKTQVNRLKGYMKASLTRLAKRAQSGVLLGYNNPQIRARVEVGKTKHKDLQRSCNFAEYQIGGKRIDCINISTSKCEVIEIKPNNAKARETGRDQLDKYKKLIDEKYKSDADVKKMFAPCEKDGKLVIEYDIQQYDYCPVPEDEMDIKEDEERN